MALRRRGIPNLCRLLHNGTLSAHFFIGSGVRQGCLLSPVLFLVVIGDITEPSMSKYSGIRSKMDSFFQHLDYADRICLLSHSVLDAANMLYSLENEAAYFGLQINTAKTKSMSIVKSFTTGVLDP